MPFQNASVEQLAERLGHCSSDLGMPGQAEYRWFVEYAGKPVGTVGLTNISAQGDGEISYHLDDRVHRRGIGSRAVAMLVANVFAQTDLHRLYATVSVGNAASIALLRALGFSQEAHSAKHYRIQNVLVQQLIFGLRRCDLENQPMVPGPR